jgi:hypothetical protein
MNVVSNSANARLPISARLIAILIVAYGAIFTALSVASLFTRNIDIYFLAIAALICGIGLLRRKRWSYLILVWICRLMIAATLLIAISALLFPERVKINFGAFSSTASDSPIGAMLICGMFLLVFGCIHWALTRSNVRRIFANVTFTPEA